MGSFGRYLTTILTTTPTTVAASPRRLHDHARAITPDHGVCPFLAVWGHGLGKVAFHQFSSSLTGR